MSDGQSQRTPQLDAVTQALGGDEERLKDLTERHLGTRDLDEADRRANVVWGWRDEQ